MTARILIVAALALTACGKPAPDLCYSPACARWSLVNALRQMRRFSHDEVMSVVWEVRYREQLRCARRGICGPR